MKKILFLISLILGLSVCGCGNNNTYTITWKNYDGSILEIDEKVSSGSMPSYDGSVPIKEKTENYEFTFSKWSPDIQPVTQDTVYMALFDSTLTAAYVSFDLNGGTTSSNSQSRYMASIEPENFFFDVKKENYYFRGWEYDSKKIFDGKGNKINNVEIAESMTFKALFAETLYTIKFVTNGGDSIDDLIAEEGDSIVIPTPTKGNSCFVGWFTDELLTNKAYISTMPGENITLYAKWAEMYTVFEIDSKQYMFFGTYPQTIVSDSGIISELSKITVTNSRGYYEYGGCEYAKQHVDAYSSSYTYSNGSKVNNNSTEYFKVEPILWRVLTSDSAGNYTLLADQAINAHQYHYFSNDYVDSEIRSWINNDFYNSAFKTAEKGAILTTTDKVFLLSYNDYINPAYGFSSSYDSYDSARYCKPTDYALANCCYMYEGASYVRNCFYWTCSPYSLISSSAWCVRSSGCLNYDCVYYDFYGVRPALNINLY